MVEKFSEKEKAALTEKFEFRDSGILFQYNLINKLTFIHYCKNNKQIRMVN